MDDESQAPLVGLPPSSLYGSARIPSALCLWGVRMFVPCKNGIRFPGVPVHTMGSATASDSGRVTIYALWRLLIPYRSRHWSRTEVNHVHAWLATSVSVTVWPRSMKGNSTKPQTTRRTRNVLLLGVGVLVAWVVAYTAGLQGYSSLACLAESIQGVTGPDDYAASDRCPEQLAERLLQYWRNQTQLQAKRMLSVAPNSTAEVLRQLGLAVGEDYCYFKMRFNGTAVEPADTFTEHCQGTGKQVLPRAQVYAQLFTRLLQQRAAGQQLTPFEFYMDLNDGTRNNVELFRRLRVPITSFSRNPHDRYTVPLPDFHLTLGIYSNSLDWESGGFGHIKGFAEGVAPIYARDWAVPWTKKISKLVYRGSCFPTLLSDNWSPSTRLNTRAELCEALGNNTEYDIGLRPGFACSNPRISGTPMCAGCLACFAKPQLSGEQQVQYKYQLIVDGIGGSSEASVMKLLSNSAVIRLRPNGWDSPVFQFLYEPMLEPYRHIIPSATSEVPAAIEWCEAHPGRCERMASAGRKFMQCFLQQEVLDDYIYGVFKYMHDSLASPQHASAEYNYALHI